MIGKEEDPAFGNVRDDGFCLDLLPALTCPEPEGRLEMSIGGQQSAQEAAPGGISSTQPLNKGSKKASTRRAPENE